jgi:DNA-binding response OmpR family regulator
MFDIVSVASPMQSSGVFVHREIAADEIGIFRLLDARSGGTPACLQKLRAMIGPNQTYSYSGESVAYLSQTANNFDIILVSGDDPHSLCTIVKGIHERLPSKAIVPVLGDCSNAECADLLRSGADDILHDDMGRAEVIARLHALLRRLRWRRRSAMNGANPLARFEADLKAITKKDLTPVERCLLVTLLEKRGSLVPYPQILLKMKHFIVSPTAQNVRMTLFKLRRKIFDNINIKCLYGRGLMLLIHDS